MLYLMAELQAAVRIITSVLSLRSHRHASLLSAYPHMCLSWCKQHVHTARHCHWQPVNLLPWLLGYGGILVMSAHLQPGWQLRTCLRT